eukprot:6470858-Amphidinium_carterae.1
MLSRHPGVARVVQLRQHSTPLANSSSHRGDRRRGDKTMGGTHLVRSSLQAATSEYASVCLHRRIYERGAFGDAVTKYPTLMRGTCSELTQC